MHMLGQYLYQQLGYPQKANGAGGSAAVDGLLTEDDFTLLTEDGEIIELE